MNYCFKLILKVWVGSMVFTLMFVTLSIITPFKKKKKKLQFHPMELTFQFLSCKYTLFNQRYY